MRLRGIGFVLCVLCKRGELSVPLPPFEDLKNDWNNHTIKFTLSSTLWVDSEEINTFFSNHIMHNIKFFNADCSAINDDINQLPNNNGGIYFFILKNEVLPDLSSHIMYIGRAHNTNSQNLRKRCRVYFNKYYKNYGDRPHIHAMLNNWCKNLYLYFVELSDNDEIDEIEKKLINNIIPPFNHDIPHTTIKKVRTAMNAF